MSLVNAIIIEHTLRNYLAIVKKDYDFVNKYTF